MWTRRQTSGEPELRITITCEDCGHRHRLERTVVEPGEIWIMCHTCETPLQALMVEGVAAVQSEPTSPSFVRAWASTLDLSGTGAGDRSGREAA